MPEKKLKKLKKQTFYVCPQCGWSSRIRYNKETSVMVCGHCPYEGPREDFEQEMPEPTEENP